MAMNDLTRVLNRVQQGDSKAADELLPLVYEELRRRVKGHVHLPALKAALETHLHDDSDSGERGERSPRN